MEKLLKLLASDKALHFLYMFLFTTFLIRIMENETLILILSILIAIAKELYDWIYRTGYSWRDMLANILGIFTALAMYFIQM